MNYRLSPIIYILLLYFMLVGCQRISTMPVALPTSRPIEVTIVSQEETPSPEYTFVPVYLPTTTYTVRPTYTRTPVLPTNVPVWIEWTPRAELSIDQAKEKVAEMMLTGTDCKLPCWWGIEPGKTRFTDAVDRIAPMADSITVKDPQTGSPVLADLVFPVSEDISSSSDLRQHYVVWKDIIREMEVQPGNVGIYTLEKILQNYGAPQEILFDGLIEGSRNYFNIYFYYPKKGILSSFYLSDASIKGDAFQICPRKIPASLLILWEPPALTSFKDFVEHTTSIFEQHNNPYLFSVKEVTGLDTEEFTRRVLPA